MTGKQLKRFRIKHQLSQQQMAFLLKKKQPTISRWELSPEVPHWIEGFLREQEKNGLDSRQIPREMQTPNRVFHCEICHKKVERYISRFHSEVWTGRFCSRTCAGVWRRGENHHQWKGGTGIALNGYTTEYCPSHPYANHQGYVLKHRLVMEKHLGRYLEPSEVVHHKNENPRDNRLKNLQLFVNQSEHKKVHDRQRQRSANGRYVPRVDKRRKT